MILRATFLFFLLLPLAAPAQTAQESAQDLRAASEHIQQTVEHLAQTTIAQNRPRALAEAIRAVEDGMISMRYALRGSIAQESILRAELADKSTEIGTLLVLLQNIGNTPAQLLVLHPDGPVASARAGMIVASITPELNLQAAALREKVDTIDALNGLHRSAMENLGVALGELQNARVELNDSLRAQTTLPLNPTEDLEQLDRLLQASDDLEALADRITVRPSDKAPHAPVEFASQRGALPLPVAGTILRRFGDRDAAGLIQPGIVISAPALSLVTAPQAGIVRFAGDFLDYGMVVIIEPAPDYLQIMAGFGQVYVNRDDELAFGDPIGLLGGAVPDTEEFLIEMSSPRGVISGQTLYIEVREHGEPVDPSGWFAGITGQGN